MRNVYAKSKTPPTEGGATFSFSNRLYRAVWSIIWFLFFWWTPPFMKGWRRFLLRVFGAKISSTAMIYGSVRIWAPYNLFMDEYACVGPGVNVYSMAPVVIRKYALVSQGAHLCSGTHDINDPSFPLYSESILIEERAWVAAEAFVGPGVTIGEGAVLGARSCAFKNLKPWTVYIGNPVREIKNRVYRN